MEEIRQREMDITKEKIQRIINSGARVILTTKGLYIFIYNIYIYIIFIFIYTLYIYILYIYIGIDDLCLKYFVEAGAIAVRRVTKEDLRRIARVTGYIIYLYVYIKTKYYII